jgi:ankyrin repeat protein
VFCAVALGDAERVASIVAADLAAPERRLGFVDDEMTPLHLAISRQSVEITEILLEAGADPAVRTASGLTALAVAKRTGNAAIVRPVARWGGEGDASVALVGGDMPGMIAALRLLGPDAADLSVRLLRFAAREGDLAAVNALLAAGADPSATACMLVAERVMDVGPLHLAVERGHVDIVRALVNAGASIDQGRETENPTPLHVAAFGGNEAIVWLLLDGGADLSAIEHRYSATPAEWAAHAGHTEIARLLGHQSGES